MDGHLNALWFMSLENQQQNIDASRWDYTEYHSHYALEEHSPRVCE